MRDMYMRSGHGFLLVYDVTSTASFAEMAVFRNQILSSKDVDSVPLVILGNKCDIEDAREISTEQGSDLAVQLGAKFFEGSAKFRKNVDEAFFAVVPTELAATLIARMCRLTLSVQIRLIRAERQRKAALISYAPAAAAAAPKKKSMCSVM